MRYLDFSSGEFYTAAANNPQSEVLRFGIPSQALQRKLYGYLYFADTSPSWVKARIRFWRGRTPVAELPLEVFGGTPSPGRFLCACVAANNSAPDTYLYFHGNGAITSEAASVNLLPNNIMLEADSVSVDITEVKSVTGLRIFVGCQSVDAGAQVVADVLGRFSPAASPTAPTGPVLSISTPPPPPNFGTPPSHINPVP